ncbi:lipopolysaccharide biosynthesis protein [Crassaminicella profunda]|uniref:lipopolysaccharide biosynthesis protein n=1 Tax=Crassaminicella profunda TaxID=1286698 RepID=UPI001CA6FF0D|nr:oligosaccharide flippase family protein [Crassaminicella profunda]QZY55334.1 oligosaccharide flippase family protein [Crassaminicella profunda]
MKKRNLAKTGSIYLMGSILVNIINLFLVPLYTNNLTTQEYGQYNIILSIQSLLAIFITLGIYSGMCRFFYEHEDYNRIKNITLTFSLLWGALIILLTICTAPILSYIVFKQDIYGSIYIKYIVTNSVLLCIISIYESYYSMKYEAIKVSFINVGKILLVLFYIIYFISIKQMKIIDILYSQFISYLIIMVILIFLDIKNIKLIFGKEELKKQLIYGLGLLPGQVSAWILTLIDRYFIKVMVSLSAVGIYSLGYKIGMLIQPLFTKPFKKVFTAYKYEIYNKSYGKENIQKMFRYYNVSGWLCILGFSIFAKIGILILGTDEYISAYKLVPIITISYYLFGLTNFYALGLHIANKMLINSGIVTICAIINIIINIVLIPMIGMYGAAISTIISYMIMNIMYYYTGNKYYKLDISIFDPYKYSVNFILLYGIYTLVNQKLTNIVLQGILNILLCCAYLILCIVFKFITVDEIKNYFKMALNKLFKKRTVCNDNQ